MHYANDINNRVPMAMINVHQGLADPRLFLLKKSVSEMELVAVISAQIQNLARFLNLKSTFSADQILDTAELVMQEFDDMSFTAIADCVNAIKTSRPPFNEALYQTIDGRKFLEYLRRYREHQIVALEEKHQAFKRSELEGVEDFKATLGDKLRAISESLKMDHLLSKIERDKLKVSPAKTKLDTLMHQWTDDYHKKVVKGEIKDPYPGQLDEYLLNQLKQYQKQVENEKTPS